MSRNAFHLLSGAEALEPVRASHAAVRIALVVLISILISHLHAEPV